MTFNLISDIHDLEIFNHPKTQAIVKKTWREDVENEFLYSLQQNQMAPEGLYENKINSWQYFLIEARIYEKAGLFVAQASVYQSHLNCSASLSIDLSSPIDKTDRLIGYSYLNVLPHGKIIEFPMIEMVFMVDVPNIYKTIEKIRLEAKLQCELTIHIDQKTFKI